MHQERSQAGFCKWRSTPFWGDCLLCNFNETGLSYREEKVKLDIEYRLENLKRPFRATKEPTSLLKKVEDIERFVMGA